MTGHERNKQSFNDIFSARDDSRKPIKSGINDECIGESADGTYSIYKNDFDKVFMFAENGRITKEVDYNDDEVDGVLENWIEIYDIKINPRYKSFVYNSRRPIKSGWVFIFGADKAAVYENDNADTYKVECRNGSTFIDEYFDNEQDAREFAIEVSEDLSQSRRPIKSGKRKSYPEKALEELEEYFDRSADGWTIYTHKLTPEDEIIIGNVCDKYNCDFALGTSHVSIYEM